METFTSYQTNLVLKAPNRFAELVCQALRDQGLDPYDSTDLAAAAYKAEMTTTTLRSWITGTIGAQNPTLIRFCNGLSVKQPLRDQLELAARSNRRLS